MNCKRIILLAAVLAAGITQARTIAITATHDVGGLASSFDLAIAAGERDEGLYVAYGNADGGGDPFAWENLDKVADIPAATTSYTVSAPLGWGADVNALRFFMIDSASFHYDSAMTYLPSSGSGNDYADTGYVPSSNTKVEIDIAYYSHGSSNSDWIYLFGERSALGAIDKSFCGYMYKSGTQTSALYANIDSGGFQNGLTALGQRIKLTFVGSSVEGDNTFKVRLYGVDAPEVLQDYGIVARDMLRDKVLDGEAEFSVVFVRDGFYYSRVSYDGRDINYEMVRDGHAWYDKQGAPGETALEKAQDEAKRAKQGLWAAKSPTPPWVFRSRNR